jgi:hypothetical protein
MAYRITIVPIHVEVANGLFGDLSEVDVAAADLSLVTRSPDVMARAEALWGDARQFAIVATDRKNPPTADALNETRNRFRTHLVEFREAAAADLGNR